MDRACAVQQIVDNIKTNVIGVGRNSATPIQGKSMQFLLPIGGMNGMNEQLKSKENTHKWAKQIQNTSNTIYVSKLYGNTIDIDNNSNPNGTLITIVIPTKLVDYYVKKDGRLLPSKSLQERAGENNGLKTIFKGKSSAKASEILRNIYEYEGDNDMLGMIAKKLSEHVNKNNVILHLDDVDGFTYKEHSFKGAAHYDPNNNEIRVGRFIPSTPRMTNQLLIHEILHSMTHYKIHDDSAVSKHFKGLYEYAKSNMNNDEYALYNVDEFMVALFTDASFISDLRNVPPMSKTNKYGNLFEEIFDFILMLFGIKKNTSFYDEAFATATHIINDFNLASETSNGKLQPSKVNDEPLFNTAYLKGNSNLGTVKKYSVRPANGKEGIYEIDGKYYRINKVYNTPVFAKDVKNLNDIRKYSIGDQTIEFSHIKEFYNNNTPMFIYKIDKLPSNPENKSKALNNEPEATSDGTKKGPSSHHREELKQEVYFKRLLKELKKQVTALDNKLKNEPMNELWLKKRKELGDRVEKINAAFSEYEDTKSHKILVDLGNEVLDNIESFINELEMQVNDKNIDKINTENLERTVEILNIFMELDGTKDRASDLYKRLRPSNGKNSIITQYALNMIKEATGNEFSAEDLDLDAKDMFAGERLFGTLSDVQNYIAKTIGYVIKKAQNKIAKENKDAYELVKKNVDKLEEWAAKNGVSKSKMYDVFIQEQDKTTVLTKEFTSEFYKMRDNAYAIENSKQRISYMNTFATFNHQLKRWEPKNPKQWNENYKKIHDPKNPELKQFYDFFRNTIDGFRESLPINMRDNFIPDVVEKSLLDIINSDKSFAEKFKDSVQHMTDIYDYDYDESKMISDEELLTDDIPIRYITNLGAEKKSRDLGGSLLKFMYFANFHKEMTDILPKTRLLQEEIKKRKFVNSGRNDRYVSGKESNIFRMTDDFIKMQVKGEMRKDDEKFKKFDYSKYIDFGIKYTSLLRIGLNPFNAISNILVGSIGNIVESIGGRYFTPSEFLKGTKIYSSQAANEESKVWSLIKKLNPLMELEDYDNLDNIRMGSRDRKDKVKRLMYSFQRKGENLMQVSTMIASLMHDKVTTKDGKSISLWEAFDEIGEWKDDLMGYQLSEEEIFTMSNKIQRINQMIHGRYSARDAATAQQYALVRAAYQFKKWIPAAIEARFQGKRFDDRLGFETEGRYITLWDKFISQIPTNPLRAFNNLLAPLLSKKKALEAGKLTETEIYNMRKNAAELVIIAASVLMFLGLGDDDDEEKNTNGFYKVAMMQLDRISGDLIFWYNPDEFQKGMVGVPLSKTIRDLQRVFRNIPYAFGIEGSVYEKGMRADENKFLASVIDFTPIAKPVADLLRSFKEQPYQPINNSKNPWNPKNWDTE